MVSPRITGLQKLGLVLLLNSLRRELPELVSGLPPWRVFHNPIDYAFSGRSLLELNRFYIASVYVGPMDLPHLRTDSIPLLVTGKGSGLTKFRVEHLSVRAFMLQRAEHNEGEKFIESLR